MSATIAGYKNQASISFEPELRFFAQIENPAPIIGPNRKPIENAIPISAMPRFRVLGVDTSVTMAVDKVTFPFAKPPEIVEHGIQFTGYTAKIGCHCIHLVNKI